MDGHALGGERRQRWSDRAASAGARIAQTLLQGAPAAARIELWGERLLEVGVGAPQFQLTVLRPRALADLVFSGTPLALAEAYFDGDVELTGDLFAALGLRRHLQSLALPWRHRARMLMDAAILLAEDRQPKGRGGDEAWASSNRDHSRGSDKEAIQFHYDLSNEFYRLWLDDSMVYSCAYFEHDGESLEQAQRNKLDHVCRKLRLKRGERLLDIGCGWGAMVCHAAKHYGVTAHGITLSERQFEFARERVASEGLAGRVKVELRDYRDLPRQARYDKASSIGMFEHVGLSNLPEYNRRVFDVLEEGGLFLNHGITHRADGFDTGLNSTFLQRYVFPDGELDRVSAIQAGMEQAGFEILDVEALRPHYAKTLRHWFERLEGRHAEALRHVSEKRLRIWRVYLAGCAVEFETGGTGIHQILAGKWGRPAVPLTRRDIYS